MPAGGVVGGSLEASLALCDQILRSLSKLLKEFGALEGEGGAAI